MFSSKKVVVLFLVVALLVLGCGIGALAQEPRLGFIEVKTAEYAKIPPWTVGFSNASVSNSWRVFFLKEIEHEFARYPEVKLLITDAMDSPSKQVSDVEDLVSKGIDLLLLSPCTAKPLTPVAERVMRMGIPVVTVDRNIASDNYVSYVHSGTYEMGKEQGEWLVKELKGEGNIVMLGGIAGASSAEDRVQGAKDVFKKYPKIKILHVAYCDWSPVKGKQVMADLLVRFPRIDGVWSGSALQGSGAVEAFVDAGKPVPPITGEDMNRFLKQWKTMGFKGCSVSNPVWQGEISARLCINILRGVPVSHCVDVGRTTITGKDLDNYVRLDLPDDFWMDNHLPEEWYPR